MDEDRRELLEVIREKSLQVGDFVLSSGKKASYYLDCRVTTLDPRGALLTARLMLRTIDEHQIEAEAIGGLTLGADPIAAAVAVVSEIERRPLPAFIVRKEPKKHGAKRQIEGWKGDPGARVIVVDDVCTSGGSILDACEKVEEAGFTVAATMCVIDRCEGGGEAIASRYPFYPLLTVHDLLPVSSRTGRQ
jgi:orotate phosphoribosyltransferase